MPAPEGARIETDVQLADKFPRVEQADGSNRTGLTLTSFYVQLRDQADNVEYQKAEGNPTPSVNNIAVTCDEVGEGRYVFAFTPNANGLWKLDVQYSTDGYKADGSWEATPRAGYIDELAAANIPNDVDALGVVLTAIKGTSWSDETLKAIKDAVDGLGGGGSGASTVTVTVEDGDGTPMSGVAVYISTDGGTTWAYSVTTGTLGKAVFHLDDATYKAKAVKSGYSHTAENLVVSDDTAQTLTMTVFNPGTPDTGYCRVYGWLRQLEEGAAVQDQRIRADIYDDDKPAVGSNVYYVSDDSQDVPDSEGYWYLDLIRSSLMGDARVKVYSVGLQEGDPTGAIDKLIRIPDEASAALGSIDAVDG